MLISCFGWNITGGRKKKSQTHPRTRSNARASSAKFLSSGVFSSFRHSKVFPSVRQRRLVQSVCLKLSGAGQCAIRRIGVAYSGVWQNASSQFPMTGHCSGHGNCCFSRWDIALCQQRDSWPHWMPVRHQIINSIWRSLATQFRRKIRSGLFRTSSSSAMLRYWRSCDLMKERCRLQPDPLRPIPQRA